MKVSFVVPSYNHSLYITACLNSIVQDAGADSEIIIIDDGSTDNSVEVIEQWIKTAKIPTRFIAQKNKGISTTLNLLLQKAQGSYIRPVASDDEIISGSTEKLVKLLKQNPKCLVAFGDSSTMSANGEILSESHIEYLGRSIDLYQDDLKKAVISSWSLAGPVLLYRKSSQTASGLYDESMLIEDWTTYLLLVAKDEAVFLPESVAKYRVHGANSSLTSERSKRIRNLESQYKGGFVHLDKFNGGYQVLLQSELSLLKAKIYFLKKKFPQAVLNLLQFLALRVFAFGLLKFKSKAS